MLKTLTQIAIKIDVFKGLTRVQLAELMSWIESRNLKEDTVVFREGDEPDGLYLLCEGQVAVVRASSKGAFRLAEVEAPSFFGEAALLIDEPRSSTVRAMTPVALGFLPKALFMDQLEKKNLTALLVTVNIARLLSQRLVLADKQIALLSAKTSRNEKAYLNRSLT